MSSVARDYGIEAFELLGLIHELTTTTGRVIIPAEPLLDIIHEMVGEWIVSVG